MDQCCAQSPRRPVPRFAQSAERRAARREFVTAQGLFEADRKLAYRQRRDVDEALADRYFNAYEKFDAISGRESFELSGGMGHSS